MNVKEHALLKGDNEKKIVLDNILPKDLDWTTNKKIFDFRKTIFGRLLSIQS